MPEAVGRHSWPQTGLEGTKPYNSSNGALFLLECSELSYANSSRKKGSGSIWSIAKQGTTHHLLDGLIGSAPLAVHLQMVRRGHPLLYSEGPA